MSALLHVAMGLMYLGLVAMGAGIGSSLALGKAGNAGAFLVASLPFIVAIAFIMSTRGG